MSYHEDFEPYDEPYHPHRKKRVVESCEEPDEPCTFTGGGDADEVTHD